MSSTVFCVCTQMKCIVNAEFSATLVPAVRDYNCVSQSLVQFVRFTASDISAEKTASSLLAVFQLTDFSQLCK